MTLSERLLTRFTNQCTETQTYPFENGAVTVSVDWEGISKKVQQTSGHPQKVVGGLYPKRWFGYFLPSFAYAGRDASYICLYPGNWRRKLYYAAGLTPAVIPDRSNGVRTDIRDPERSHHAPRLGISPLDPRLIMTYVVAHEARHIQQGVRGYGGIKNALLFPGIFLALPASLVTALATIAGTLSFWWPIGLFAYYHIAKSSYFYDSREVDARAYAKAHVNEWLDFASITTTYRRNT